jgi:hypothetical protein
MNTIQKAIAKVKLRFFPTANLVAAYELLEGVKQKDAKINDAIDLIYNELLRRGDESLVNTGT